MKTKYYYTIIEENKHSIKNTWKILNSVLGKENNKSSFPQTFQVNNEKMSDRTKIAEAFNNYFSNIGKITNQNVPQTNKHYTEYLYAPRQKSMYVEPVETVELINIVSKMKSKTSYGHDNIPTKIIKQSIFKILEPLKEIINKSLSTGIVPKQLKIAKVIPIFKQSDPKLLNNYRPISLLPAFSKIFEKVVFNRMMNYLNDQNILYKHQYGFRSKHSTIHPILHFLNNCAEANNARPKQLTLSVFCDLSKAFDVISHDILLKKLENYGFRGVILNWLKDYLSNRFQYVEIENVRSKTSSIEYGVPQGSILGPLLYLIYVNDIPNSTDGNLLSFADDTSLYMSDPDLHHLFRKSNIEIQKLFNWFCANRLSLNPTKTKYMVLRGTNQLIDLTGLSIKINGIPLSQIGNHCKEQSTKFLGIYIDESLSWTNHIKHINMKISRALFVIKQIKNVIPKESLRTLYFATIHPHLSYGILAWGNASSAILNKTNILQKRAIRTISKANFNSHTEPLLKQLSILKLKDLYEYEVALFMYKFTKKELPLSFQHTFNYNHEIYANHSTRQSSKIYIRRCDSRFAKHLPLYNFPVVWNKWCFSLTDKTSVTQVKGQIKRSMLNSYSSKVRCYNSYCKDCTKAD